MVVSGGSSAEIAFPRGGRVRKIKDKSEIQEKRSAKEKDLFSASVNEKPNAQKKRRKKHLEKKKAKDEKAQDKAVDIVDTLSYGQIVEGMLILGRISSIRELDLRISLPGRLIASCPITNISSHYTKALKDIAQGTKIETDSDEYPRYYKLCNILLTSINQRSKVPLIY